MHPTLPRSRSARNRPKATRSRSKRPRCSPRRRCASSATSKARTFAEPRRRRRRRRLRRQRDPQDVGRQREVLRATCCANRSRRPVSPASSERSSRAVFAQMRVRLDYSTYGGAPLLGVRGNCVVAHGRSDRTAIRNAIRQAATLAEHDLVGSIGAACDVASGGRSAPASARASRSSPTRPRISTPPTRAPAASTSFRCSSTSATRAFATTSTTRDEFYRKLASLKRAADDRAADARDVRGRVPAARRSRPRDRVPDDHEQLVGDDQRGEHRGAGVSGRARSTSSTARRRRRPRTAGAARGRGRARAGAMSAPCSPRFARDRASLRGFASIPDLSHAVRTGRVSRAQAFVGSLVKIVPCCASSAARSKSRPACAPSRARSRRWSTRPPPKRTRGRRARVRDPLAAAAAAAAVTAALRAKIAPRPSCSSGSKPGRSSARTPVPARSESSSSRADGRPRAGVYVHLPFCPYICPYCDFAKWAWDDGRAAEYLRRCAPSSAPRRACARTLFFGGGTPTTYEPAVIGALIGDVRARFALPPSAEITAEANPDPSLAERLGALRARGREPAVDRRAVVRAGRAARAGPPSHRRRRRAAVRAARAAGFANLRSI